MADIDLTLVCFLFLLVLKLEPNSRYYSRQRHGHIIINDSRGSKAFSGVCDSLSVCVCVSVCPHD